MPEYKTTEQVRKELEAISPKLVKLYDVRQEDDRVILVRGDNSIICRKGSYGGSEGLYEIYPSVDGKGIKELFGRTDNVVGWLELKDAVEIAETAITAQEHPNKLQALEEALNRN